jgi:hypothetical protein
MMKSAAKAQLSSGAVEQIDEFRSWLSSSATAAQWLAEREDRLQWYATHLTKSKLPNLQESDLGILITRLWAVEALWHNKEYKARQVITRNGAETLKSALFQLLYDDIAIEKRWDRFRSRIKGLGPAMLSELLTFFDPYKYALFNRKPAFVLPLLGVPIAPVDDGASYAQALQQIGIVRTMLKEHGMRDADFLVTDFFVAYLYDHRRAEKDAAPVRHNPPEPPPQTKISSDSKLSHEAVEAYLLRLGTLLGFDTYTPDSGHVFDGRKLGELATLQELPICSTKAVMEAIENVDVVWVRDEVPELFFEVEHSTGVTSGLLRMFPAAEKLAKTCFVIAPEGELKKFQRDLERPPFKKLKARYQFRSYEQLQQMYTAASQYRSAVSLFLGDAIP